MPFKEYLHFYFMKENREEAKLINTEVNQLSIRTCRTALCTKAYRFLGNISFNRLIGAGVETDPQISLG